MVPQAKFDPFYFHALSRQYVDILYEANFTIIFQQYVKGKYLVTRMLMCVLLSMEKLQIDKELKV
jgi:hypothetical protein